jgi:hypothetical protein
MGSKGLLGQGKNLYISVKELHNNYPLRMIKNDDPECKNLLKIQ